MDNEILLKILDVYELAAADEEYFRLCKRELWYIIGSKTKGITIQTKFGEGGSQ